MRNAMAGLRSTKEAVEAKGRRDLQQAKVELSRVECSRAAKVAELGQRQEELAVVKGKMAEI